MIAHSIPLVSLGAFILIFGFFAFNGGSQVTKLLSCKTRSACVGSRLFQASITSEGDGIVVAKAIVNTLGKYIDIAHYDIFQESSHFKLPAVSPEQLFFLSIK